MFFLFLVCIVVTLVFILSYFLIPANPFQKPSGKWHVSTTDLIWDRPDLSGIIAKVWYPTEIENNTPAPYIDQSTLTAAKNPLYKFISKLYLERIKTPVSGNAICGHIPDGFPVILFSPGLGAINILNTSYALEFASHGLIVVGINHPGSSAITLLSDGSVVGVDEKTNELNKKFFSNNGKFLKEKPAEFARLVYENACGDMMLQADNLSCVLDKIFHLNSTVSSPLYQKVNEAKIFAGGHSIGGAASFIVCGQDRRISKGLNLDGYVADPSLAGDSTNYDNKELLLIHSDREQYPKNKNMRGAVDILCANDEIRIEKLSAKASLQRISFRLAGHLDFSDLPLLITIPALVRATGLIGDRDGRKLLQETAAIAIKFFNSQPPTSRNS